MVVAARGVPRSQGAGSRVAATRSPPRRAPAGAALAALLLWVAGFELLPNLHVAVHPTLAPHTHDGRPAGETAGEVTVVVTYTSEHFHLVARNHHHAGETTSHHHLPEPMASSSYPELRPRRPLHPTHGSHSLAHRGETIGQPPPVLPPPPPSDGLRLPAIDPVTQLVATRRPLHQRVRGPPRTSQFC